MKIADFINQLKSDPNSIEFSDTMATIDANYQFNETGFTNGQVRNEAGQNSGSCKIFAFAKLQQLSLQETLQAFGSYYRVDVMQNPQGIDHANIRNFMETGWEAVSFDSAPLTPR